jgi:hypothetical protein
MFQPAAGRDQQVLVRRGFDDRANVESSGRRLADRCRCAAEQLGANAKDLMIKVQALVSSSVICR